nr:uncharacterized protein LOC103448800 [Malus domestica]
MYVITPKHFNYINFVPFYLPNLKMDPFLSKSATWQHPKQFLLLLFCFSFLSSCLSLSALSHLSLLSLFSAPRTHARTHLPARGSPSPFITASCSLSLSLSFPRPQRTGKGAPARFFNLRLGYRTKSKPGVSTPNSGDLGGFSGHLRPFHDERKGQLLVTFSCSLVCVTLRRLSTDLESRRTIPASRHFRIGIFESSRCRTPFCVHSNCLC